MDIRHDSHGGEVTSCRQAETSVAWRCIETQLFVHGSLEFLQRHADQIFTILMALVIFVGAGKAVFIGGDIMKQ